MNAVPLGKRIAVALLVMLPLVSQGIARGQEPAQPTPAVRTFNGTESLGGYGGLSFDLHPGGRAIMHDTTGITEGTWSTQGDTFTLRFDNGRVVYTGTQRGNVIFGCVTNGCLNWSFSVSEGLPPQRGGQIWVGNETLCGYGRVSFVLYPGGRAQMYDVDNVHEGFFELAGDVLTMRFNNGRVVYTGTRRGDSICGFAYNDCNRWSFDVRYSFTDK